MFNSETEIRSRSFTSAWKLLIHQYIQKNLSKNNQSQSDHTEKICGHQPEEQVCWRWSGIGPVTVRPVDTPLTFHDTAHCLMSVPESSRLENHQIYDKTRWWCHTQPTSCFQKVTLTLVTTRQHSQHAHDQAHPIWHTAQDVHLKNYWVSSLITLSCSLMGVTSSWRPADNGKGIIHMSCRVRMMSRLCIDQNLPHQHCNNTCYKHH